jgi:glutamate decarboxylase
MSKHHHHHRDVISPAYTGRLSIDPFPALRLPDE